MTLIWRQQPTEISFHTVNLHFFTAGASRERVLPVGDEIISCSVPIAYIQSQLLKTVFSFHPLLSA